MPAALMFFPTLDEGTGELVELVMVPMRMRRFRLARAERDDAGWLAATLTRASRHRIVHTAGGRLTLTG